MKVIMLIICWTVQHNEIVEAWRIERPATLENCIFMNRAFSQGGRTAVMTVRCGDPL